VAPSPSPKEETTRESVLPDLRTNLSWHTECPTTRPTHFAEGRDVGVLPLEFRMGFRKLTEPTEWDYDLLEFQSGTESAVVPSEKSSEGSMSTLTSQNVQFDELNTGETVDFGPPSASVTDPQKGITLGKFFARPTLIKTYSWTEAAFADTYFDPWSLYFNDTYIKSKLNNFYLFRGRLHVKFIVNAAPFYYGALRVCYTPLQGQVNPINLPGSNRLIPWSQRPGIWILPQDNAGGDLVLPYVFPAEYTRVSNAVEVATMGQINILQYAALASANGATSNGVTIQVYAWLEDDYEVSMPTNSLAMQSKDEYGNGPVSAPASAVARAASYLHNVPVIGSFAKATTIGASAVSSIAKIFGWTNVPIIEDVKPFKNIPFHDLASAHISEPTYKFTLDPKAELSVDPHIVGPSSDDELSFAYLLRRESYLTQATWDTTAAPGALLFSSTVMPAAFSDRGTAIGTGIYGIGTTPVSWVSECFDQWRGDLVFRFKFIASTFHRGRVRITWDPYGDTTATTDYTNVCVTKIVDLSEETDVEFIVPYAQHVAWTSNYSLQDVRANGNYWSTATARGPVGNSNGSLTVRVLNNLSAPVDTASVAMFVNVRGGENLEFANPRDMRWGLSTLAMQSGHEDGEMPLELGLVNEKRFELNWGEPVHSARLLMRRSCLVDSLYVGQTATITSTDKLGELYFMQGRNPPPPGYDAVAPHVVPKIVTTGSNANFGYSNITPINWFAPAFVGQRGSLRWHFSVSGPNGLIRPDIRIVRAWSVATGFPNGSISQEGAYRTIASSASTNVGAMMLTDATASLQYNGGSTNTTGQRGIYLTNQNINPGIGVEFPHMGRYRFYSTDPANYRRGGQNEGAYDYYQFSMKVFPSAEATGLGSITVQRYCGAGTDFSLNYFLNSPPIYAAAASVFGASPVS